MPPQKPVIKQVTSDLNIVLNERQLTTILQGIFGPTGKGLPIAFSGGTCCVDASVGSSVAGPVSSVASSVSVPGPVEAGSREALHQVHSKVTAQDIAPKITLPANIKVK